MTPTSKDTKKKSPEGATRSARKSRVFTAEERAAIKEHLEEMRAEAHPRRGANKAGDEGAVLAKIAALPHADRVIAERLHAIIKANAATLSPKTWYGMPAYTNADGKVLCYFQSADKFKTRYATLGFSDKASLDEGSMWPTVFALKELTPAEEAKIVALLKRAVG